MLVAAVAGLVVVFSKQWAAAAYVVWAVGLSFAFLLSAQPREIWRVESSALVNENSSKSIPFESIIGLQIRQGTPVPDRTPLSGPLAVIQRNRSLVLKRSPATWQLYCDLAAQVPLVQAALPDSLPASLRVYATQAITDFGAENVYTFLSFKRQTPDGCRPLVPGLTSLILSIAIACVGVALSDQGVGGIGFFLIFFTGFWLVIQLLLRNARHVTYTAGSGLIVSPRGFAMHLGAIKGKLRWDEVLGLKSTGTIQLFNVRRVDGLQVQVEGATIVVPDIFDRPLPSIYLAMKRYRDLG